MHYMICFVILTKLAHYCVFGAQIRPLWRHYFQNTQGLIFVVDSNDRDRVVEARDELHRMLNEVQKLLDALLFIFFSSSLKHFVYIMWVLEFVGWVEGCCAACICQQAGSSKCYECCRDHWQTWSPFSSSTPLVLWWILMSLLPCHILAHAHDKIKSNWFWIGSFAGTFRVHVPLLGKGSMRVSTGSQTILQTRFVAVASLHTGYI